MSPMDDEDVDRDREIQESIDNIERLVSLANEAGIELPGGLPSTDEMRDAALLDRALNRISKDRHPTETLNRIGLSCVKSDENGTPDGMGAPMIAAVGMSALAACEDAFPDGLTEHQQAVIMSTCCNCVCIGMGVGHFIESERHRVPTLTDSKGADDLSALFDLPAYDPSDHDGLV